MPHYRVVTYNDQDSDTWPRLKGKAEFEKYITKYLNKGYTCVGGYNKEYVHVPRYGGDLMHLTWSQALVHTDDNPPPVGGGAGGGAVEEKRRKL